MTKENNKNNLRAAIIRVMAFFDMFDYPLTQFEIWRYSDTACSLPEVKAALEKTETKEFLEEQDGFYFFSGRKKIVETRMRRYNFADKKIKRAMLIARIFRFVPWIKLIAASNIIGANNQKDESDIDLFIVTERKRIWITRFFCAGWLHLFRLRPKPDNARNKICLNFYVSEDALNLEPFQLSGEPDIYFVYWLSGLAPIFIKDDIYEKLMAANSWLREYLPNWEYNKASSGKRTIKPLASPFYRDLVDLLIGGLEVNLGHWQTRKLPAELKINMNKNSQVVVNERVLKLHAKDRREEYRKRWKQAGENWL